MLKVDFKITKDCRNKTQVLAFHRLKKGHTVSEPEAWRQHEQYFSTNTGMSNSLPLTLE